MSKRKQLTLMMILNEEQGEILLGMKKRGFGCGWWNGFGGKVKENETILECAKRETLEECGLNVEESSKIGHIVFEFENDPVLLDVHIYLCLKYSGSVTESEEMRPKWFKYSDVPFGTMWPDDYLWYPFLFKKQKFQGYFLFRGHNEILKTELKEVDEILLNRFKE